MRLIDADKLKTDLEKAISKNEDMDCLDFLRAASVIDEQPTAYDPDKVVAELKKESESSCGMYTARCPYIGETIFCEQCAMLRAIQIVKGGGVDGEIDKMD